MEKTTLQPFNYEAAAEVLMELMAQFMRTDLNRSLQAMVHGECFALLLLNSADTWLLPSDLSAGLSVSSARITKLLDTLESKQIIVRQPDPNDRRTAAATRSLPSRTFRHRMSRIFFAF